MTKFSNQDVSAIVCTKDSISGIRSCLVSLRESGVGQIIVVDAHSTDGTEALANEFADLVLSDPGVGLGNARNVGVEQSTKPLILNMGSDNVLPRGELEKMIAYLEEGSFQGVSAQTRVLGEGYFATGLNAWRTGRFREGERPVIGTPTLFLGDLLRDNPFDPSRKFSDDSELCERWSKGFNARFAISDATFQEVGKNSWQEIRVRAQMYGISDHEIFSENFEKWTLERKLKSILHPIKVDFFTPARHVKFREAPAAISFLGIFTVLRYAGWFSKFTKASGQRNS